MPMWDYQCPDGHINEVFGNQSDFKSSIPCPTCTQPAEYMPSFYYNSRAAQQFAPVIVHKDSEGNVRFPAHANAPLPPGYHRIELTDINQVRKFENEVNKADRARAEGFHNAKAEFLAGQLKENRRVMEGLVKQFTPRGRRFYDKMREVSEARQKTGPRPVDPGFYIEAFSQDASNREAYRDAKNNWGKHHGSGK